MAEAGFRSLSCLHLSISHLTPSLLVSQDNSEFSSKFWDMTENYIGSVLSKTSFTFHSHSQDRDFASTVGSENY